MAHRARRRPKNVETLTRPISFQELLDNYNEMIMVRNMASCRRSEELYDENIKIYLERKWIKS